ncbi:receptor-like protein kinase FERONIA [Juglans microcarpa x Juglans regia]|uniref:receptor-like protein kinase FERONIA n=1 Tax=Juglans microcarpa x Juglans regia TaxID=2249226 RepID=UPI001B7DB724|nr:receptor-like protein kinase FERONIA [Juglans microcarpa x Juglans regia]
MRNVLSVLPPTFCVFFFFFNLCHAWIATPTPRYIPVENIAINCGTSGNSTDMDHGRIWIGDVGSKFSPVEENGKNSMINSTSETQDPAVGIVPVPYKTARKSYFQFTYVLPVTPGPKFVRLHFYPRDYSSLDGSRDFFTVKAGSYTLLADFSASDTVNADDTIQHKTLSKEFCVMVLENEKQLNLMFIPRPSTANDQFYAFINGFEIVSMPYDLYYSRQEENGIGIPYIGQTGERVYISTDMPLETVYRLNVGGNSIPPSSDTGMFREWSNIDVYYRLGDAVISREPFLKLNYSAIPNYTAPDELYRSAISMGPNRTRNLLSNLTWELPIASGFNYLVRLHFCELESVITMPGGRSFTIYIDNQTAKVAADVIEGKATPVFRDYVVKIENNGLEVKSTMFIALQPGKAINSINDVILNGVEVLKLSNIRTILAKPLSTGTRHESKLKNTIIIVTGSGGGFLILLTLMWFMVLSKTRKTNSFGSYSYPLSKYCCCWPDPSKRKSTGTKASSASDDFCRHFSLGEIKIATRNFHEELIVGVGGFGNVYKGLIDKGTVTVAIKRLNRESRQGVWEFRTEIEMLSRLRHVHLVSLIGYCEEEGEMILVYDYMANGTLRHHLYDLKSNHLPWKQRLKICIGAARGLHYLHTGANHPIIHRDVKTTNILLDQDWVAKVSDFGLSKMSVDNTEVSTMVKGTWGYLDPDYARRQKLSEKSDVYSFGVVLWEVLCARKALDQKLEEEQWNLANWATKCIERGSIGQIIDPYLKGKIAPKSFKVYVEVAEGCVREQGIQRPTMDDVMEKLRFALELQENEDAAIDKLNSADGLTYPNLLSYHYVVYNEHTSEIGSNSGLTTTTISESTRLARDSSTIQSSEEGTTDSPIEIKDSTTH